MLGSLSRSCRRSAGNTAGACVASASATSSTMAGASDRNRRKARFVLDCSVALSWCFPDEKSRAGQRVLAALAEGSAIVPALWFLEVANALLAGERRGRLTQAEATEAIRMLRQLPLEVDGRAAAALAA